MKRTNVVLLGLVVALTGVWLSGAALAGDKSKKGAGSKSGSAAAELDILFRLAGRWKVAEEYPAAEGEEEGPKGKGAVFTMFNVSYEDGMVTSNRRISNDLLDQSYGDAFEDLARTAIEDQDNEIAERSGRRRAKIKSIARA